MRVALLVAGLLAAGCLGAPADDDAPVPPPPARDLPPIGAPPTLAAPVLVTTITGEAPQEEPLLHTDALGRMFLATPHVPALHRSDDDGATWTTLFDARTDEGEATAGFTDGALASDDAGNVYWLGLEVGGSRAVPFQRSEDGGATWSEPVRLAEGDALDRQWLASSPAGALVALWADSGVVVRTSADRGVTWTAPLKLSATGYAGPVTAGAAEGEFVFAFADFSDGALKLARTTDEGASWNVSTVEVVPAAPPSYGPLVVVQAVAAVDEAGTIYVAYARDDPPAGAPVYAGKPLAPAAVFLAVSADGGATFAPPLRISPEGRNAVMAWTAAGAAGRVAVAWYEDATGGSRAAGQAWWAAMAASSDADAASPTFHAARATEPPGHVGGLCNECGAFSRLDHLGLAVDGTGAPVVAWIRDTAANPRDLDVVVSRASDVRLR